MFEFQYRVTEEEYLRFNRDCALHSGSWQRAIKSRRLNPIIYSACLVLIAVLYELWLIAAIVAAAAIPVCLIAWLNAKSGILRRCDRAVLQKIKSGSRLYPAAPGTLTFTEERIHDENPDLITTCPYHTVERLILCRGAVYVFFSAMQAFILPESAFSGDEERKALLNFLKEKTQKAVEVWE